MDIYKNIGLVVGGGLLGLLLVVLFVPNKGATLGSLANCSAGYTCYTNLDVLSNLVVDGTFTLGSSGTAIAGENVGTCYIAPYATTIAASSSVYVDCQGTAGWNASATSALAGVTLGDAVQVTLSTTTATGVGQGLVLAGASASSTTGHIQLRINNMSGATYTWPVTLTASGTASFISTR